MINYSDVVLSKENILLRPIILSINGHQKRITPSIDWINECLYNMAASVSRGSHIILK